jgi:hypothetical protein
MFDAVALHLVVFVFATFLGALPDRLGHLASCHHTRAECRPDIRICHSSFRALSSGSCAMRFRSHACFPSSPARCCRHSAWCSPVAHCLSGSFARVDRFPARRVQRLQLSAPKVPIARRRPDRRWASRSCEWHCWCEYRVGGPSSHHLVDESRLVERRTRAVFQPVVVAIFAMTLLWFGGSGMVTSDVLHLFFMGLPAAILGTWFGLKLYGTLDEVRFRRIILLLLLISGLTLLPFAFTEER